MKTLILIVNLLLLAYYTYSQNQGNSIEVEFYFKYDRYPSFSYSPNPTRMHKVNASGTSFGGTLAYRLQMQQRFFLKAGVGYYKYSFSKMKVYDPIFGEADARLTLYMPQNTRVYLATPKYWLRGLGLGISCAYSLTK